MNLDVTPMIVVPARRGRRRPYTIAVDDDVSVVITNSATRALRAVDLVPGAVVRVCVPLIVNAKRAKRKI